MSQPEDQGSFEETARTGGDHEFAVIPHRLRRHKGVIAGAVAIPLGIVVFLVAHFGPIALLDTGAAINVIGLITMFAIAKRMAGRRRTR